MAKKKVEKAANHERWLLTYADMITLLMIFFIVLWSMSNADSEKFQKISASLSKAFSIEISRGLDTGGKGETTFDTRLATYTSVQNQIRKTAQDLKVGDDVDVKLTSEGIIITLSGNFLFESGRADLLQDAYPLLESLADSLRSLPNDVRISGHTDNVPINTPLYGSNWDLSVARSVAVVKFLMSAGIQPNRLTAAGHGEYRPVMPNDTRAQRAKNRRAEVLIVFPDVTSNKTKADQSSLGQSPLGRPDQVVVLPAATPAIPSKSQENHP